MGDGRNVANAQQTDDLWGTLLRVTDSGDIPPGNAFTGAMTARCHLTGAVPAASPPGTQCQEIYAYGFRNAFRFAVDPSSATPRLFVNDVGATNWEEINVASIDDAGLDFAWPNFEGTDCYQPSDGCGMVGWEEPIIKYSHEVGCSVTGGYVYRGDALPELDGHYFYADWCNGLIRSFRYDGTAAVEENDWTTQLAGAGQVASFGIDGDGEMLVVDSNGKVYRVVRA